MEPTLKNFTINVYQGEGDDKKIIYKHSIPEHLMPYFRTWNSILECSKELSGDQSIDLTLEPLTAPINNIGSEEYLKKMIEFAEFVHSSQFPKDRKITLDPAGSYEPADFEPTTWEIEFFKRVNQLEPDQDILKHMLTKEQYASYKPNPNDPTLCLYYASNYINQSELLEACAKNIATMMENLSIKEMQKMFHEEGTSEQN